MYNHALDSFYIFSPDKKYLAIDEDQNYISLSNEQFQTCQHINHYLVCQDINVIYKPQKESCLTALFHSNFKSALGICNVEIRNTVETVIPLKNNRFVSVSKVPVSVYIHCTNGTSRNFQLPKLSQFSLPSQCYLDFPLLKVFSSINFNGEVSISHYSWPTLFFDEFLKGLDHSAVEDLVKFMSNKTLPPVNANVLKALNEVNKSKKLVFFSDWPFLSLTSISIFTLLLLLILLFIFCCLKTCKKPNNTYRSVNQN